MDEHRMWESVEELWAWIDRNNTRPREQEVLLSVLKLSEEVGEAAQAVIGAMGHNPRKGVTHDWEDVRAELCDVALSALVALRILTPDAGEEFTAHVERVRGRSAAFAAGKAAVEAGTAAVEAGKEAGTGKAGPPGAG